MAREKFYHMWGKAVAEDGSEHYVTVVAQFLQEKKEYILPEEVTNVDENGRSHESLLLTEYRKKTRTVRLAKSICDPRDTFNEEVGVELAKRRIRNNEVIGSITSDDITMLNADHINMLLLAEVNHICKNIDTYITKR